MKGKYPPYDAEPITDVRDLFLKSTERFADRIALQHKKDGRWVPITYRELRESVESVACALAALGLRPQENKVAIVSENRPEWAIAYLAAACTGIVLVPIDKELRETEVYHILYLSGADALIGDARHIEMVEEIRRRLPRLKSLVNMDRDDDQKGILVFARLRRLGADDRRSFNERTVTPDPERWGTPKG
ncbi:MAG: hypothetical protein DMG07_27075 [Acidobacteria bacterium]|nr:MAG: hypothetical protein DMG07_27075 [Acidobacteriota bacterium]